MIDHAARAELRAAVEDFLFDRCTSSQFDERRSAITTADATVRELQVHFWFYYDDLVDHHINVNKQDWDQFQRLLLLLDSGGEITATRPRHWHGSQLVAILTLVALAVAYHGNPQLWLPPVMSAGLVSIALFKWRDHFTDKLVTDPWRCAPFATISSLREALERAPGFRKARYRREIGERQIRSPGSNVLLWIPPILMWLLFSPLVLLVQSFPCRTGKWNVSWR
jgi:hypothetical protein